MENLDFYKEFVSKHSIEESLKFLTKEFSQKIVFSTSFQAEDQVITDIIFRNDFQIEIFTIDTGRHFEETYKTFKKTTEFYKKNIKVYFPNYSDVERLVNEKGFFSFYESIENRVECCHIRKVLPLKRALEGKKCWITGLRKEQSQARQTIDIFEYDEKNQIFKYNPLIDWTFEQVWDFIRKNNVPYNILQDRGFVSIGCEPCTRAIKPGEDLRAGRWWWENNTSKECGLHTK